MPRHRYHDILEEYSLPEDYTIPDNYTLPEEWKPGVEEHPATPEEHATISEDGPRGQKRKRESDEVDAQVDLTPQHGRTYGTEFPEISIENWLDRQPLFMINPGHELRINPPVSTPGSDIDYEEDVDQEDMDEEDTDQDSLDSSMLDIYPIERRLPRHLESDYDPAEHDHASSLGAYMQSNPPSFNSVRPPDPFLISESMPFDLTIIAPSLLRERAPPKLPRHILKLPFRSILRRYNRLTKVIDDYQRWHGREIFGFWVEENIALAQSGEVPELTKAFNEDRPSVPPLILTSNFDFVLRSAPLLSHLVERYHKDLGFDYFGFYHFDPRDNPSDIDDESSISSDEGRLDRLIRRVDAGPYGHLFRAMLNNLNEPITVSPRRTDIGQRRPHDPPDS
ncbi:hypothetical protein O1611_g6109 [Lasiodiplodia mahajangana]|uniref:Uncharacterized protein n=1 Tax=Lasiodiplodia mahajangana TaxID=1108764 RepID=A0ACC2JJN2_9PEZI|nr:hypothetical protein O1611_g6109 [Lasiodiplodia mahajangana]